MKILISGASIAGPVAAYWLARHGFEVTVVERTPALRKTGGHAVDLFRPAMDIAERMGVLPALLDLKTGTDRMTIRSPGARPVEVDLRRVSSAVSDRHIEIMRDDLSDVFYEATRGDVEYVFGDSITSISADGEVTFERGAPRRFDVVIGADGLHSNVRRLVFGDVREDFIGAYLAVQSLPGGLERAEHTTAYVEPGRIAAMYSARNLPDARAVFLFHSGKLDYHYRDAVRQKELLRSAFTGMTEAERWLDHDGAFYFDSVTQLRMDTWSRGRVALVGDAGHCPGPAVGGSTSLAVVGAYTLAGELAAANGDHERAFASYEAELGDYVRRSRTAARAAAKRIVPATPRDVWLLRNGARLVSRLPMPLARALARFNRDGISLHDTVPLKDYPPAAHAAAAPPDPVR
ncbi:2-polyprenyl-6-methoxyphenol hydroxylase-like FAD-dependent oxidoreductase [Saccharothrix tamanrassetensis]|uniref:2-polyprenyl-6-methoxyphenol hydroxylase-like FAD-dependent oxidoreductase n=1 Tax=Saccharothrix tamanrassetensis TaxID=1051531 RepID=A0A841CXT5_9PSEU|nr:FAD-dependent monooxygenase [Saccharothrix tamanrassetensis]MBB5960156.1 2-polyprenyl-6-methoxyphenol hydroxylase-like FAD-dependent oxidoreductase [Saccharothrix tamanrassetensis]